MVITNSSDRGETFSTIHKIANDRFLTGQCITAGAPMEFDNQGVLHVAWYTGKESGQGIYYAKSSDNGSTFSNPYPINAGDFVPPSKYDMSVDDNHYSWIVWENLGNVSRSNLVESYSSSLTITRNILTGIHREMKYTLRK